MPGIVVYSFSKPSVFYIPYKQIFIPKVTKCVSPSSINNINIPAKKKKESRETKKGKRRNLHCLYLRRLPGSFSHHFCSYTFDQYFFSNSHIQQGWQKLYLFLLKTSMCITTEEWRTNPGKQLVFSAIQRQREYKTFF